MKECFLYKKEKEDVRCYACSHKCLIKKGESGICGVRKNIDGNLILLVYGKFAAIHVDPIEKKPLYHFLPKTLTFSIGTIGCNFKCDFCQNWEISQVKNNSSDFFGEEYSPLEIVEMALKSKCKSISYTYNEPIIFSEFIYDCAKIARDKKLKNIMVSNGYWSDESFNYLKRLIDAVNIDLKGDNEYYKKFCGGNIEPVIDTIKRCHDAKIHVEITTLIVSGENDDPITIEKLAKIIASIDKNLPWHITRFFPHYKMNDKDVTDLKILKQAKEIGEKLGLKNIHIGNV